MKKRVVAWFLVLVLVLSGSVCAFGQSTNYSGQTVTLLIHPTLYKAAGGDSGIVKEFEKRTAPP